MQTVVPVCLQALLAAPEAQLALGRALAASSRWVRPCQLAQGMGSCCMPGRRLCTGDAGPALDPACIQHCTPRTVAALCSGTCACARTHMQKGLQPSRPCRNRNRTGQRRAEHLVASDPHIPPHASPRGGALLAKALCGYLQHGAQQAVVAGLQAAVRNQP